MYIYNVPIDNGRSANLLLAGATELVYPSFHGSIILKILNVILIPLQVKVWRKRDKIVYNNIVIHLYI